MSEFEGQVDDHHFGVDDYQQDEVDKAMEEAGLTNGDLADMAELQMDMENAGISVDSSSAPASPSTGGSMSAALSGPPANSTKIMPKGAMPTTAGGGLSSLANEFWFPESRNCSCCKGYKHGCKCRVGTVDVCQDPLCTTNVSSAESMEYKIEPPRPKKKLAIIYKSDKIAAAAAASVPVPAPAQAPAAIAAPAPAPAPTAAPAISPPAPIDTTSASATVSPSSSAQMCTFFNSPAGCRFGATCRFSHGQPAGQFAGTVPAPVASSPQSSPSPSSQPCMFFRQGSCRNGPSCRFAHI